MKKKILAINIFIPIAVGAISGFISRKGMNEFETSLEKPPLTPPSMVFPIVWTILYTLMGIACYMVYVSKNHMQSEESINERKTAMVLYGTQLFFNFCWSIAFFKFKLYAFSFFWLLVLLALVIATACKFIKIEKRATAMIIPYIIWVAFAAYLNFGIWMLNK